MTSAISRYYEFATLSQAAYAEFSNLQDSDRIEQDLKKPGKGDFTEKQAKLFTDPSTGYDVLFFEPTDARHESFRKKHSRLIRVLI